jgi:hypothetical protein
MPQGVAWTRTCADATSSCQKASRRAPGSRAATEITLGRAALASSPGWPEPAARLLGRIGEMAGSPTHTDPMDAQDCAGAARNALCEERRRLHRLPGHQRGSLRPRLRPRLGLACGARMERPRMGRVLPAPRFVLAPDHLRQAWDWDVGPRRRCAHDRDADGRRPRRHGCRGLRPRCDSRPFRGRPNERGLRRHLSRATLGASAVRCAHTIALGARLPLGLHRGRLGSDMRRRTAPLG